MLIATIIICFTFTTSVKSLLIIAIFYNIDYAKLTKILK